MALTTQNETLHAWGFVVSEMPKTGSRDKGTLVSGQANLKAGTVLGKLAEATSAPVYAAAGGNTGNFTCGTVTESAGAVVGAYSGELIDATHFNLFDPSGNFVGEGTFGTAFSGGGLGFTITAGATPGVVGDKFTITVAASAGAGKFAALNLTGADGTQTAAAILGMDCDATSADAACGVMNLNAEVNGSELIWPNGITTNQKNAAIAQLLALGIKVR